MKNPLSQHPYDYRAVAIVSYGLTFLLGCVVGLIATLTIQVLTR